MDTRADFQRLLEDMDKVIKRKQEELAELDERLEESRSKLSEREAKELLETQDSEVEGQQRNSEANQKLIDQYIQDQQTHYEQQLAQINEELLELESINRDLTNCRERLSSENDFLRASNEKLQAKMHLLTQKYDQVQSANFELNMRLAQAESESQMQQKLLKKSHEQDQILMDAFNEKLESLKRDLLAKDEEIRHLRKDNQITFESLGIKIDLNERHFDDGQTGEHNSSSRKIFKSTTNADMIGANKKQKIIEIANLLRDKDAQIENLKGQLLQATREMEDKANQLEELNKAQQVLGLDPQRMGPAVVSSEICDGTLDGSIGTRCAILESELEIKDKQLHMLEVRNRHFESILPQKIVDLINNLETNFRLMSERKLDANLDRTRVSELTRSLNQILNVLNSSRELLDVNAQLQKILQAKDRQIGRLVRELNEMDERLNGSTNGWQLGTDFARTSDPEESNEVAGVFETSQPEKLAVDEQTPAVAEIETDQGIDIQIARSKATQTLENNATGLPISDGTKEDDYSSHSDSDRKSNEINREKAVRKLARLPDRFKSFTRRPPSVAAVQMQPQSNAIVLDYALSVRLKQIEDENQMLELAMKEILMSIRTADARCGTILIDCPSLERLCQLIEAKHLANTQIQRSIASDQSEENTPVASEPVDSTKEHSSGQTNHTNLFQLIVMKGELDLLRGQNEQLRSELKLQRRECYDLLTISVERGQGGQRGTTQGRAIETNKCLEDEPHLMQSSGGDGQEIEVVDLHQAKQQSEEAEAEADPLKNAPDRKLFSEKCPNCNRLINLAQNLLECITRIETRVNLSDETYVRRLLSLYQLTQQLGQDLTNREQAINQLRLECRSLLKQKLLSDTRSQILENQNNLHLKVCPIMSTFGDSMYSRRNSQSALNASQDSRIC